MTEAAPTEDRAAARAATAGPGWRVREAGADDVAAFAAAVEALLDELGGRKPSPEELRGEVEALLAAREAGSLLVAEAEDGAMVGVLSASWQRAIHVPGVYATIQDLWVAQPRGRRRPGRGDRLALPRAGRRPDRGRPAARDLRGDRRHPGLLRAQRLRPPGAADAEAAR